ncbi:zinc finger BED domain-containing protein RICESLEEPER 3-like [Cucumis melo var. makuwa]|uniref:Zinc finger BED domain-containing protein RICESLEEPER 3-like n=1 Tax=Cucumis melo var. makuwa TaxID=1194695 RepID=A0A5D3DWM7_CUCMM|nr:zinc finger BED domain-containing protein RICESLEEPER 3-like [Cucumis melo var. makuwa]
MDSTNMELECDGSCETSKIVRDEDTDGKRKTIDVDLDSYGREDVPNPPKIRKNVKQSMVWDHFERLKGDPNDPRAKCKYCGVVYACHSKRNGTGTMKHHLENCKKYPYQKKRDQTQMTLAFKPKDKVGDNSPQLVCESFSLDGCGEALVEMIIVDELPFKFVAGKGFKKFVDKLTCGNHTRFVVPSRFTVARDVLKFFCPIENHKGDTIGKTIEKNLKDWGIERILSTIVEEFEDDATTPFEQGSLEIDIYLLEANVMTEGDFDILQWWKMNSDRFEVLGHMARDILAILVSTVASESAFSTRGRVVDLSRCSLAPKTVEALICTQNWLNSDPIHLQVQHELEEASKFEEGFRVVMENENELEDLPDFDKLSITD